MKEGAGSGGGPHGIVCCWCGPLYVFTVGWGLTTYPPPKRISTHSVQGRDLWAVTIGDPAGVYYPDPTNPDVPFPKARAAVRAEHA